MMMFQVWMVVGLLVPLSAFAADPLTCVTQVAKADGDIPIGLAAKLCSGSWSLEPVKCYKNVANVDAEIPRGIAIDLCAGSLSAEKTVRCYEAAARQFNRGIATTLCGAKKQADL